MKAVFLDYATLGAERLDASALFELLPDLETHEHTKPVDVDERIRDAEVVFVNKVRLPADSLRRAPRLRYVGIAATGADNVDIRYAAENGIAVTNVRGYCTQSVVEHVFGVLIAHGHSLHRYRRATADGQWQQASIFCLLQHRIRQLSAMTLGIVGYGTLGRAVAATAEHFGMKVLVSERVGGSGNTAGRTEFRALLAESDAVSLHCPLTAATDRLIGAPELALMQRSAILINTARGRLVDSHALVQALESGRIGGAAIDVLAEEPPVSGDPLLDYRGDNLIVTPHIAWATETARQQAIDDVAANFRAFRDGRSVNRIA